MTLVNAALTSLSYAAVSGQSSPAAETAIVSCDVVQANVTPPAANTPVPQTVSRPVVIEVNANITFGTGATAVVFRVRQGIGTGGAPVTSPGGTQSVTLTGAAGNTLQFSFKWRDTSGVADTIAGTAYTVTVAQTGATVAGTVNAIDMEVKQ